MLGGVFLIVELGGVSLNVSVHDEETNELKLVRSVSNIKISDVRSTKKNRVIGMDGGYRQDLGKRQTQVSFDGVIHGEEAKKSIEDLRSKYKALEPLQFISTLSGIAEISQVLIENFRFSQIEGYRNHYRYSMVLREYLLPPEEEGPPPNQDEEAQEETEREADDVLDEDFVEGTITDEEDRPIKGVTVVVSSVEGEWTERLLTDDDGNYRTETKFRPDKYTVSFEVEGFDRTEVETEIESSK